MNGDWGGGCTKLVSGDGVNLMQEERGSSLQRNTVVHRTGL